MTGPWFVRIYGWLALGMMLLWCLGGAGIYGSPLPTFHGKDLIKLVAILIAGPVLSFVAALYATKSPATAMVCLLVGAVVAALVLILGFSSADYPLLTALVISGPMLWGAYCLLPREGN